MGVLYCVFGDVSVTYTPPLARLRVRVCVGVWSSRGGRGPQSRGKVGRVPATGTCVGPRHTRMCVRVGWVPTCVGRYSCSAAPTGGWVQTQRWVGSEVNVRGSVPCSFSSQPLFHISGVEGILRRDA